jgi:hypothetical protein
MSRVGGYLIASGPTEKVLSAQWLTPCRSFEILRPIFHRNAMIKLIPRGARPREARKTCERTGEEAATAALASIFNWSQKRSRP